MDSKWLPIQLFTSLKASVTSVIQFGRDIGQRRQICQITNQLEFQKTQIDFLVFFSASLVISKNYSHVNIA